MTKAEIMAAATEFVNGTLEQYLGKPMLYHVGASIWAFGQECTVVAVDGGTLRVEPTDPAAFIQAVLGQLRGSPPEESLEIILE